MIYSPLTTGGHIHAGHQLHNNRWIIVHVNIKNNVWTLIQRGVLCIDTKETYFHVDIYNWEYADVLFGINNNHELWFIQSALVTGQHQDGC